MVETATTHMKRVETLIYGKVFLSEKDNNFNKNDILDNMKTF